MTLKSVSISIDRKDHNVAPGLIQGKTLLELAQLSGAEQLLLEVSGDIDVPIAPNDWLIITGNEKFSIGRGNNPIEDNPALHQPLRIYFNNRHIAEQQAFHRPKVTGAELRALDPNIKPADMLIADLEGFADEPIPEGYRLILKKGDRFITVPCGNVGFDDVLSSQLKQVQEHYPAAHLVQGDSNQYLVVPDFSLPSHWSIQSATLLVSIPNGYPMSAPDMFWVDPAIRLLHGGEPSGGNCYENHLGKTWQRFSWHYRDGNAWSPSASSLLSHLNFAKVRLAQAL